MHQGTFRNVQPISVDIEHVNRICLKYTDVVGICFHLNPPANPLVIVASLSMFINDVSNLF